MVYAQSWEDVCEGAICSQSFTGFANGASAGSVPNVSTSGFKISGNGASGSTSDKAAWSANTSTNYLAFKHTQLETGYEYRISVNAKSRYSGKTLAFGYGPALNQSQAIGAPAPVLTVHPSLPGVVVTSDLFTVDQAGIYYIILRPGGTGSGNVILDDYRLERRVVVVPVTVSLLAESVTIEEGSTTTICMGIENPSPTNNTKVKLGIDGSGSPHFLGYTTQEIIFLAGSTEQQCITLSPSEEGSSAEYSFYLFDLQGVPNAVIGEVSRVVVTVDPIDLAEICDWAGPDVVICQGGEGATIGNDQSLNEEHPECWDNETYCVKWIPEEGLDDPNSIMPLANPTETTTYTVYVSDNNGNFYGEDQVTVEVIGLSAAIDPAFSVFCGEESINLEVTALGGQGELSYQWSDANNSTTSSITVNTPDAYSVTVTDENGCQATANSTIINENFSEEEISQILLDAGFLKVPIEVIDIMGLRNATSSTANTCQAEHSNLLNYIGEIMIEESQGVYCLNDAVISDLEGELAVNSNVGAVITNSFCLENGIDLNSFLNFGNTEYEAVMMVYILDSENQDFMFVGVNNYQNFTPVISTEDIVYPPNLDALGEMNVDDECNDYRIYTRSDGILWGHKRDVFGNWDRDTKMETLAAQNWDENFDTGDRDNTCCDGDMIDIENFPWNTRWLNFWHSGLQLRSKFDFGLVRSNDYFGCSSCPAAARSIRDAFYDGETREIIWQPNDPFTRYLRRLDETQITINQIKNRIEEHYNVNGSLSGLFSDEEGGLNTFLDDITRPNYNELLHFGSRAIIGGTQNLSIEITGFRKDCDTGTLTCILKIGIGDIFGAGETDGERWLFPGLISQFILQHFRNNDCNDEISNSEICYTPLIHWVYFNEIFTFIPIP
jgi:hypothetical protein